MEPDDLKADGNYVSFTESGVKVSIPKDYNIYGINVEPEKLDKESIVKNVLSLNNINFVRSSEEDEEEETEGYRYGGSDVIIYPSGALIFTTDEASDQEIYLTIEEAQKKVEEFIEKNGGLPDDAYLERIETEKMTKISTGEETILGYLFIYKHSYNNVPIGGGDAIKIRISNSGITSYFRLHRNVISECERKIGEDDKYSKMKNIKEILEAAKEAVASAGYKQPVPPKITQIQLAYCSKWFKTEQDYMPLTWEITVEGGSTIYIDPITGESVSYRK